MVVNQTSRLLLVFQLVHLLLSAPSKQNANRRGSNWVWHIFPFLQPTQIWFRFFAFHNCIWSLWTISELTSTDPSGLAFCLYFFLRNFGVVSGFVKCVGINTLYLFAALWAIALSELLLESKSSRSGQLALSRLAFPSPALGFFLDWICLSITAQSNGVTLAFVWG